jgi:nucleotide-binding universal stress UspA family protein
LRRVLLAVDGSEGAMRAVRHVQALRQELRDPAALQLHLINVQRPVSGDVSSFVSAKSLDEYHRERSEAALAPAREWLATQGLSATEHQQVGAPGPAIAQAALQQGCDLIVMGSRGLGTHTSALVGSVALGTLEHAPVPVLLVK